MDRGDGLMLSPSNEIAGRLTTWFLRKTSVNAVRRIAAFPAALSSDIGLKRDENQDRVAIARGRDFSGRPYLLAGLSDGIGGMKDGAACAAATLGHLFANFFDLSGTNNAPDLWLTQAAQAANAAIFSRLAGKGGATLSALLVMGDGNVYLLNVGDSRIYRVAGSQLVQLTVDDTIAGQLGHKVEADLGSNLLQFIGIGKELETNAVTLEGAQTDPVLLTSDGIHFIDQSWLGTLVHYASDPGVALRRLTETSKWCGGHDNASAAMLLPHLAIQEPFANGESEVQEIWDPFGELQLVLPRSRSLNVGSAARKSEGMEATAPAAVIDHSKAPSAVVPSAKSSKTKKKRDRRPKTQAIREIDDRGPGGGEKPEIPQLKIEFPHKAD